MTSNLPGVFAFCVVAATLCPALPSRAETRRVAIVVGNNAGGPTDKPLHYAEEDATKMADVLAQLGDVHGEHLFLLKGRGRKDLESSIARATELVTSFRKNPEDRTVLIFYYSGHSDGDALELGNDRVPYAELREWLLATRTDVRVVVVDGCKSGALVQHKGGTRGPPFEIKLSDQLDATGEAMLTSSAADELALESREIRGSFFTHHLVSGLRGAADASGDGRITLSEAYQYAFDHTLTATASTGVRQHPGYDYRLAGKGELVLTEMTQPSATLELPAGFERALIVLVRRDQVLAELTSDLTRRIALAPGEYAVRVWKGTQSYAARTSVAAGEAKTLSWSDLQSVPAPSVAEKGHDDAPDMDGLKDLTPEARAEYLQRYLSIGEGIELRPAVFSPYPKLEPTYTVYQGRYRKKVEEDDFFKMVDRDDLAKSYESRRAGRVGLMVLGGAVMVGTLAYGFSQFGCDVPVDDPRFKSECVDKTSPILAMTIGIVGGGALVTAGFFVNTHPAEPHDMRRLADEYNQALIRKLGGPPAKPTITAERSGGVALLPLASPRGGGLAVAASF
jgi:caspase domain-containing protein